MVITRHGSGTAIFALKTIQKCFTRAVNARTARLQLSYINVMKYIIRHTIFYCATLNDKLIADALSPHSSREKLFDDFLPQKWRIGKVKAHQANLNFLIEIEYQLYRFVIKSNLITDFDHVDLYKVLVDLLISNKLFLHVSRKRS